MPGDPLVGRSLGPYRLEARIGVGATGVVYRVSSDDAAAPLALKVLHEELGSIGGLEGRYRREAAILGRLSHPNIVRIRDFGAAEGRTYIAMDLLVGQTLEEALAEAPLHPRRALAIYEPVLEALAQAHALGIVHRDLKPANVFLHRDGRIMLLDFGLSKILSVEEVREGEEPTLTRSGRIVGTPGYMAPEQITGAFIDARADVYALGVMLFELLADRRPFMYERRSELLRAHLLEDVPDPTALRPGLWVDPALDALIRRALHKTPSERFADARAMHAALRELPEEAARVERAAPRTTPRQPSSTSAAILTNLERLEVIESTSASGSAEAEVESPPPPPAPRRHARWLAFGALAALALLLALAIVALRA